MVTAIDILESQGYPYADYDASGLFFNLSMAKATPILVPMHR